MADSGSQFQSATLPIGTTLLTYRGHPTGATAVCWSPDGSRIASGSEDRTVQVWDAASGATLISYREHSNTVFVVSWSPDSSRIASGSDQTVQVWDAVTGAQLVTYQWHSSWKDQLVDESIAELMFTSVDVCAIAWSPDGKYIAIGSGETVQIWDVTTCTQLTAYEGHSDRVNAIAWSPLDSRIASCSDATVQVWDATTGVQMVTYQEHRLNYIWSGSMMNYEMVTIDTVVWCPDGERIASGSSGGEIYIWDAATGATLVTYREHASEDGCFMRATWSPDGRRIASFGDDEMTHGWDAATGATLMSHQRRYCGRNCLVTRWLAHRLYRRYDCADLACSYWGVTRNVSRAFRWDICVSLVA